MGWEFCDVKHIEKTRKPHICVFCRRVIPAGSPNIKYWAGLTDNGFQRSYACHWCEKHEDKLCDDDDEILDFWECLKEDIFSDELQPYRSKNGILDIYGKTESDYFVFHLYDTGEEVLKFKCPIISEVQ